MSPSDPQSPVDGEQLFINNLAAIENIARHIARRYRLAEQDAEELAAEVKLKLISDDYKILAQYEGRSKLETYLFTVINSIFWEWRNHLRGRWRPSAEAKRGGDLLIKLEELVFRDGLSAHEAIQILRTNEGVTQTEAQLEAMLATLPQRTGRGPVSDSDLDEMCDPLASVEQQLIGREGEQIGDRLQELVRQHLVNLTDEDQLILKLHFHQGLKLVRIAQSLGFTPKKLYRKVDRLLIKLRQVLARQGVDEAVVKSWLASILMVMLLMTRGESRTRQSN